MHHGQNAPCIDACIKAALECEHWSDQSIQDQENMQCARMLRDCAHICLDTATLLARDSDFSNLECIHCATICDTTAAQCAASQHDGLQRCAQLCRTCAEECRVLSNELAQT